MMPALSGPRRRSFRPSQPHRSTRRRAVAMLARALAPAAAAACAELGAPRAARADARQVVRVYATTDRPFVQALIEDFERLHPSLRVDYRERPSAELFQGMLAAPRLHAAATAADAADVVWSSAMDLQIKLVNDGHAARHVSEHAAQLPRWAVWKHEAYGTGPEPVGMVVRRELAAPERLPRTHGALAALLATWGERQRGRVATYDITRAGLGYLLAAQDLVANPRHWDLVQALGRAGATQHTETRDMLERVADGRALLAYNVLGSYAEPFVRRHQELALVYFDDYTLVATRVAFVSRLAPNPAAARLWLDHLLSASGQGALAGQGGLLPIRVDLAASGPGAALIERAAQGGRSAARPITLGPGLLAHLDQSKRAAIERRWVASFTPA